MSGGFKYLEGGPFRGPDDIIVDEYYAQQHKLHAGDMVTDILNRQLARLGRGGRRQTRAPVSCPCAPCRISPETPARSARFS